MPARCGEGAPDGEQMRPSAPGISGCLRTPRRYRRFPTASKSAVAFGFVQCTLCGMFDSTLVCVGTLSTRARTAARVLKPPIFVPPAQPRRFRYSLYRRYILDRGGSLRPSRAGGGADAPLRPRDFGASEDPPADTGDSQPHQKVPLHLALCSARWAVCSPLSFTLD